MSGKNGNGNGHFKVQEGDMVEIRGDVIVFFREGEEKKVFTNFKKLIHMLKPWQVEEYIIRDVVIPLILHDDSLTTKLIWDQDPKAERDGYPKYNIIVKK